MYLPLQPHSFIALKIPFALHIHLSLPALIPPCLFLVSTLFCPSLNVDTSLLPKSIVSLGFTVGVVHAVGLDRCIMTCIYHHCSIQSSFTALKILCAPAIYHFLLLNYWQQLIFVLSP